MKIFLYMYIHVNRYILFFSRSTSYAGLTRSFLEISGCRTFH